jgi:hypothetical protein
MRRKRCYQFVVQWRAARVRGWKDYEHATPFRRHRDALDLAQALTKRPENRGHDEYFRVQRREVKVVASAEDSEP